MKPYIKICGVTNDQDLKELIKLDIDAIGFNRDKDSPRYVSFEFLESSGKCFNEKISPVIVFVNESKEGIKKAISYFKNPILQFHGDESQDFCASFNLPYIKAISMNEKDFQNKIIEFGDAFAILLDSGGQKIRGGTGKTFDWKLIPKEIKNNLIIAVTRSCLSCSIFFISLSYLSVSSSALKFTDPNFSLDLFFLSNSSS